MTDGLSWTVGFFGLLDLWAVLRLFYCMMGVLEVVISIYKVPDC